MAKIFNTFNTVSELESAIVSLDSKIRFLRIHKDLTDCQLREATRFRKDLKATLKITKQGAK